MTTIDLNTVRPAPRGMLHTLVEAVASHLTVLLNARRNRRVFEDLLRWNDHMLADIGLTRDEVRSALSAARFSEDPSKGFVPR